MNGTNNSQGGAWSTTVGWVLGLVLMTAGLGSVWAELAGHPVPVTSVVALILVLGVIVAAARISRPWALLSLSSSVLPAAIVCAIYATVEERWPLAPAGKADPFDGLRLLVVVAPTMIVASALTGLAGGAWAARAQRLAAAETESTPRNLVERMVTGAVIIGAIAALLLALPSVILRPSPERYLATLPLLGRLDALPSSIGMPLCEDRRDTIQQRATFGDLHVWRNNQCGCGISLASKVEATNPTLTYSDWYKGPPAAVAPCGKLTLRRDSNHRFVLLETEDDPGRRRAYRYPPGEVGSLDKMMELTSTDLADSTGPSSARVLPALAGLVVALGAVLRPGQRLGYLRLALAAALLPNLPLWVSLVVRAVG